MDTSPGGMSTIPLPSCEEDDEDDAQNSQDLHRLQQAPAEFPHTYTQYGLTVKNTFLTVDEPFPQGTTQGSKPRPRPHSVPPPKGPAEERSSPSDAQPELESPGTSTDSPLTFVSRWADRSPFLGTRRQPLAVPGTVEEEEEPPGTPAAGRKRTRRGGKGKRHGKRTGSAAIPALEPPLTPDSALRTSRGCGSPSSDGSATEPGSGAASSSAASSRCIGTPSFCTYLPAAAGRLPLPVSASMDRLDRFDRPGSDISSDLSSPCHALFVELRGLLEGCWQNSEGLIYEIRWQTALGSWLATQRSGRRDTKCHTLTWHPDGGRVLLDQTYELNLPDFRRMCNRAMWHSCQGPMRAFVWERLLNCGCPACKLGYGGAGFVAGGSGGSSPLRRPAGQWLGPRFSSP